MAVQPQEISVDVRVNLVVSDAVGRARRHVKRVIADAGEANRALAQLETTLGLFFTELAELGIRLEG